MPPRSPVPPDIRSGGDASALESGSIPRDCSAARLPAAGYGQRRAAAAKCLRDEQRVPIGLRTDAVQVFIVDIQNLLIVVEEAWTGPFIDLNFQCSLLGLLDLQLQNQNIRLTRRIQLPACFGKRRFRAALDGGGRQDQPLLKRFEIDPVEKLEA